MSDKERDVTSMATTSLTRLCNCCGERYEVKRTNPYCDWCRAECTNEGCTKPPAEGAAPFGRYGHQR